MEFLIYQFEIITRNMVKILKILINLDSEIYSAYFSNILEYFDNYVLKLYFQ